MSPLLEVKNLKKYFNTPAGTLHAVDGVNFQIEKGETLGVVGESGCGKSTLGRVILHLLDSTDGQIFFEGEDITKARGKKMSHLRGDMQIVFQDPYASLDPRKTVSQIIAEPLIIQGKLSKTEIDQKVSRMLDTVGLAKRVANSYPHELDGGRRQRIGIGRALILRPKFIICDEPVSALDVSIQAQILNLLQDLQDEMNLTYIFITHDLSVVKYISHHILVMYLGQVVEKCSSRELFREKLHPYTKALLSAVPVPDIHMKKQRILLQGELTSPIDPKPGCRFAARCPYAKEVCSRKEPVFEEVREEHFVACHFVREINHM
ncbi:ATP-binding cassette domain-containing protein [Enterocloster citroniae]|uniref:ABC transporter ATP-binding protein n=2 Tax=Bacillati TaxID=1783272 RepID=UPI001D07AFFC|nr:oligopeptide/dipeptide ABC transporter ATP-binding protein [Enterocloster citroniae]MCB7067514.1 ATP-binding cassette domain-containing protein [Enterocloster citroniae]